MTLKQKQAELDKKIDALCDYLKAKQAPAKKLTRLR